MKPYIDKKIQEWLAGLGSLRMNEPMSEHASFKTGGPADALIYPRDTGALSEVIAVAADESIPLTVVGGCTNLLVGDRGVRGIVVKLGEDGTERGRVEERNGRVYASSAVRKKRFLEFCAEKGFEGMEFMSGIPGCIGGGIVMNAGIKEAVFADILEDVEYIDMKGSTGTIKVTAGMSGYRNLGIGKDIIITGGYFKLEKTKDGRSVKERINAFIEDRKKKHPLDWPSAGSVFKNPAGHSSWKLIDEAGLKGKRIGGAEVSDLHTNFIINAGNATSADILSLIDHVRETVSSKTGIILEPEIRMIGEF